MLNHTQHSTLLKFIVCGHIHSIYFYTQFTFSAQINHTHDFQAIVLFVVCNKNKNKNTKISNEIITVVRLVRFVRQLCVGTDYCKLLVCLFIVLIDFVSSIERPPFHLQFICYNVTYNVFFVFQCIRISYFMALVLQFTNRDETTTNIQCKYETLNIQSFYQCWFFCVSQVTGIDVVIQKACYLIHKQFSPIFCTLKTRHFSFLLCKYSILPLFLLIK